MKTVNAAKTYECECQAIFQSQEYSFCEACPNRSRQRPFGRAVARE